MTQRVFISGLGALGASGMTTQHMWDALLAGEHGIAPIQNADVSSWEYQLGGELKSYEPRNMLPDRKLLKAISRQDVLGIHAGVQAIESSGMLSYRDSLTAPEAIAAYNDRTGVYIGSPGNKYFQQYDFLPLMAKTKGDMHAFGEQFMSEVHPMWLLRILPNNVLAYLGISYQLKGANHNVVNHATGGMQALIEAHRAILAGEADRIVVVAYDIGTDEQALFYYQKLGLLSKQHIRPFDSTHDGTVLAEGAAALVIESEESIKARGAKPLAEIKGGYARTESSGLFSIEASGDKLKCLIQDTLNQEGIHPSELNCVVAHANGNPKSDMSEARAIAAITAEHNTPVTGFKWSMGHTLCASGVMDAVLSTQMLNARTIPGLPYFTKPAEQCSALNCSASHQPLNATQKPYTLLLNRGFGSMNTTLVLKACE